VGPAGPLPDSLIGHDRQARGAAAVFATRIPSEVSSASMNSLFEYLYRDGGNWKQWGSVVFRGAPPPDAEERFRKACDRSELFIADQVRLPEVFFTEYPVNDDDHCYHEYWSIAATDDPPNDAHDRTIDEFVEEFELAKTKWRVFAR
jgi:hypothetical protein